MELSYTQIVFLCVLLIVAFVFPIFDMKLFARIVLYIVCGLGIFILITSGIVSWGVVMAAGGFVLLAANEWINS